MTMRKSWVGGVMCAAMLTMAMPVFAQDTNARALMDRIERLERDIRTLNVQIARGGSAPAMVSGADSSAAAGGGGENAYARLIVRMAQLENDLRSVTGRLEEMSFKINQVSQQMEKMTADVDFRLNRLEQGDNSGAMRAPMTNTPNANAVLGQQMQTSPSTIAASPMPENVAAAPQAAPAPSQNGNLLGTLSPSDLSSGKGKKAAAPNAAPAPKSEADALLAQLTGDAPVAAAPSPAPVAAPATSAVVPSASQPAAVPVTESAALPSGTAKEQYMHAFGLLRQGKYDVASAALRQFLEQHGDDKLASNARYWLGETYYVRGSFVEAAETFLEGYQNDPKGPKAPDALLKLGMSLSSLGKKSEACAAFQKLRSDYPEAPAGLKSTLQRESQKNGCV